jgi:uncharacterized membrane protein
MGEERDELHEGCGLIFCLGLVVANPCIIWESRVVVPYARGGVMALDGVLVFNVTYLSRYSGLNFLIY